MPHIGIFWVHNGHVFGKARGLSEGIQTLPNCLDSPDDHVSVWEISALRKNYPDLRDSEYFDVPRGRVIFNTKTETAIIYLDKFLSSRCARDQILEFFDLTASKISWKNDSHYTTDPKQLDRLFRE